MTRFHWSAWGDIGEWAIFLLSITFAICALVYAWMGGLRDTAAFLGY